METTTRSRRPSLALVVAVLALVIALSTNADALPGTNTVTVDDITTGAVTTPKLRNNAVATSKVANTAITTPKLRNNAVSASKIANGAVTPDKLSDHVMWALVKNDGTLMQGAGVEAVQRINPGLYYVRFEKSVAERSFSATVMNEGSGNGQVNAAWCQPVPDTLPDCIQTGFDNNRSMLVNTEDSSGANADRYFVLRVDPLSPDRFTVLGARSGGGSSARARDPGYRDVAMEVHLRGCGACAEEAAALGELLASGDE